MPVRLAIIAEDQRFADFLLPACRRLAREAGAAVEPASCELTRGCRIRRLKEMFRRAVAEADLVVVGADCGQEARYLLKARKMQAAIDDPAGKAVLAIAAPSIEAWLLSDPTAIRDALGHALGVDFRMPRAWPLAETEREAKDALGRVIADGTGGRLPRHGFEYAGDIVLRCRLLGSASESLAAWAKELRRRLAVLSPGA